jgi:hypothetical protein
LPFDIVKSGRDLENSPAFLTFSQKQWNRHIRGVKQLGRPFPFQCGKISQRQKRGLHARRVKISRVERAGDFFTPCFIGFFQKNQLAPVVLKVFPKSC